MLVVQCANGHVAWIFVETTTTQKKAVCLNDQFVVLYDGSPSQEWAGLLQSIVQHSVALRGAFANTHWVGL